MAPFGKLAQGARRLLDAVMPYSRACEART